MAPKPMHENQGSKGVAALHKTQLASRKSLAFLDQKDSKIEMLYKHYQVIKSYQHAFDELIEKA